MLKLFKKPSHWCERKLSRTFFGFFLKWTVDCRVFLSNTTIPSTRLQSLCLSNNDNLNLISESRLKDVAMSYGERKILGNIFLVFLLLSFSLIFSYSTFQFVTMAIEWEEWIQLRALFVRINLKFCFASHRNAILSLHCDFLYFMWLGGVGVGKWQDRTVKWIETNEKFSTKFSIFCEWQ